MVKKFSCEHQVLIMSYTGAEGSEAGTLYNKEQITHPDQGSKIKVGIEKNQDFRKKWFANPGVRHGKNKMGLEHLLHHGVRESFVLTTCPCQMGTKVNFKNLPLTKLGQS